MVLQGLGLKGFIPDCHKSSAITLATEKSVLGHFLVVHDRDIIDGINIASKSFQSGKKTAYSRAQNAPERLDLF